MALPLCKRARLFDSGYRTMKRDGIKKSGLKNPMRAGFSRKQYKVWIDQIADSVGARFSRGNIAGQNGFLLTSADLERERRDLREKLRRQKEKEVA